MIMSLGTVAGVSSSEAPMTEADWIATAKEMGRSTDVWRVKDWSVQETTRPHEEYGVVHTTQYTSPIIKLMTGAAHFTLNPLTEIPFPKGDYSLLQVDFSIIDENGDAKTPLSEVYNHHWLIGTSKGLNPLTACEDNMFFGAGNFLKSYKKITRRQCSPI